MQVEEESMQAGQRIGHTRNGKWPWGRLGKTGNGRRKTEKQASHNSRAKNPSSSSLRVGAGKGAPGPSGVGSLTEPASPKGFNDWNRARRDGGEDVLTGTSASRRDQPIEFSDSRNELEAILLKLVGLARTGEMIRPWSLVGFAAPCSAPRRPAKLDSVV